MSIQDNQNNHASFERIQTALNQFSKQSSTESNFSTRNLKNSFKKIDGSSVDNLSTVFQKTKAVIKNSHESSTSLKSLKETLTKIHQKEIEALTKNNSSILHKTNSFLDFFRSLNLDYHTQRQAQVANARNNLNDLLETLETKIKETEKEEARLKFNKNASALLSDLTDDRPQGLITSDIIDFYHAQHPNGITFTYKSRTDEDKLNDIQGYLETVLCSQLLLRKKSPVTEDEKQQLLVLLIADIANSEEVLPDLNIIRETLIAKSKETVSGGAKYILDNQIAFFNKMERASTNLENHLKIIKEVDEDLTSCNVTLPLIKAGQDVLLCYLENFDLKNPPSEKDLILSAEVVAFAKSPSFEKNLETVKDSFSNTKNDHERFSLLKDVLPKITEQFAKTIGKKDFGEDEQTEISLIVLAHLDISPDFFYIKECFSHDEGGGDMFQYFSIITKIVYFCGLANAQK